MPRQSILSLAVVLLLAAGAGAQEQIHDFHADIEVRQDGSLRITETIRVTAAGDQIKHGIYRDFPTIYRSAWVAAVELPFDVVSVERDGRPEPFHSQRRSNGVRVYVGGEDELVPDGEHTYQIVYTTNYQLGYFADHDELYWNVTGNGWEFPIQSRAAASVRLPDTIPRNTVRAEGYTGPAGSQATHLTARVDDATGLVQFATSRPLAAGEGLTIVVAFPKGYVRQPTAEERRNLFLRSNVGLWGMLAGMCVVLGYYFVAWVKVGRDPPGGLIMPQFDPPRELSPAGVRYLRRMGYDRKCFTAAVIDLAVKGHAVIEERDGEYSLRRVAGKHDGRQQQLSSGEQTVLTHLLPSSRIEFKQANHERIKKAIQGLGKQLAGEFDRKLFAKNRGWLVPGWILSALAVIAVALSGGAQAAPVALFMSVWLSFWTFACAALGLGVVQAWRSAYSLRKGTLNRIGSYGSALLLTAFATPFFIGEVVGLGFLALGTSIWVVPMLVFVAVINWWFWHLIKQPTVEGQRVRDEIEGFRMYLGTAEKEYLNRMHEPERTPELFEKYLPYALALDVENEWAEKFADVLARSSLAPNQANGYSPAWYHGSRWNPAMAGAFAGGLGSSFGNAISSSATAPGKSSGSGGGGSSGGGGGGGGGGGW